MKTWAYINKIVWSSWKSPFISRVGANTTLLPSSQSRWQPIWVSIIHKIQSNDDISANLDYTKLFDSSNDLESSCKDKRRNLSEQERTRTSSFQQDLKLSKRVTLCLSVRFWEFSSSKCEFWTRTRLDAISAESRAPAISWNLSGWR